MKAEKVFYCNISRKRIVWILSKFILIVFVFISPTSQSLEAEQTKILQDVPFLSQAPTFQWSDEHFQSACEETSALMAFAWMSVREIPKTSKEQAQAIRALETFEENHYGVYHDTSAADTALFMKDYTGNDSIFVKTVTSWRDILSALEGGSLVLVPADGRKLKNPNFKGRGPEEHMLVVRGYDYTTNEFITNDPGTRKGKEYRYSRSILQDAIRDYRTGKKESPRPRTKVMIVVDKS